jgi:macrolide transport system ATP-binding/permease protein
MSRVAGLLSSNVRERALADEIESHLQLHIDDNLRAGMTPEQARREAILKLGGVESAKEACRDRSTVPVLENLSRDTRYAIRQFRKNSGFACIAVVVLALGICASVAIFAFVDAALIKPLPYPNSKRLVGVAEHTAIFPRGPLSYPDYLDWKKFNKVFGSLEVYARSGFLLGTPAGAVPVQATRVSDGFFRTLGVRPVLGRNFYKGEDLPGAAHTVLLSYAAWQKRYGGEKTVIGRSVSLSGIPFTVIGVLPFEFEFAPGDRAEFWTTLDTTSSCATRRSCHNLDGIARLKDGVSIQAALAGMVSIAKQLERQYPDSNRGQGASVVPLSDVIAGDLRPILLVLLGGAGLLLLIACVNLASLLVVRSEGRKREMAVRSSLGASRARLMSHFFIEGSVLVMAGAAVGMASAHWAIELLTKLIPEDLMARTPFLLGVGLNVRVLSFAGTIALFAVVLFSLAPAARFSWAAVREDLAEASRGSSGNTWRRLGSKTGRRRSGNSHGAARRGWASGPKPLSPAARPAWISAGSSGYSRRGGAGRQLRKGRGGRCRRAPDRQARSEPAWSEIAWHREPVAG